MASDLPLQALETGLQWLLSGQGGSWPGRFGAGRVGPGRGGWRGRAGL